LLHSLVGWVGLALNRVAIVTMRRRANKFLSHDLHEQFQRQCEQMAVINVFCIFSVLFFTAPTTVFLLGTAAGLSHKLGWWRTIRMFTVLLWAVNSGANMLMLTWKNEEFRKELMLFLHLNSLKREHRKQDNNQSCTASETLLTDTL
jgi:hypothetical protein